MNKYKSFRYSGWLLVVTFTWLGIIMHFYIPNMGGMGLALPQNIVSWAMMALLSLMIWLSALKRLRPIFITPTAKLFFIGVLVLGIPLLYTQPEWREMAFWRWAGLLGGWIFYFSWLQVRLSHRQKQWVLYSILLATVIQALLALLQICGRADWLPYPMIGARPYGVFQQVNALASFVATGLALTLITLLLPQFSLPHRRYERGRLAVLGVLLVIFPALLVWLQSRVGWLGGGMVAIVSLLCFGRYAVRRSAVVSRLLFIGLAVGLTGVWSGVGAGAVSHASSDGARGAMLSTAWTMLLDRPWLGWGMGGFEYNFQHFRLAQGLSTEGLGVVVHPHNELLFWAVEGGGIALSGLALLLCGGGRLVVGAWRRFAAARSRDESGSLGMCIAVLPVLLHTQTEYPFDLSVVHWAVFLLVLAQIDLQLSPVVRLPAVVGGVLRGLLPVLALTVAAMMAVGVNGGLTLTQIERDGVRDFSRAEAMAPLAFWGQRERWLFDAQTYSLLTYNRTRDELLLEDYAQWAQGYLMRHVDANVYASLLLILRHQEQDVLAEQRRREAALLFPQDPRFRTEG